MQSHAWSSEMTFGEFVLGLYKESAFPYDRHLAFSSRTQGATIGNLLVELLERSPFVYNPEKSSEIPGRSVYVYEDDNTLSEERVIEIKVHGANQDCDKHLGNVAFPPECSIEIECMGFPF